MCSQLRTFALTVLLFLALPASAFEDIAAEIEARLAAIEVAWPEVVEPTIPPRTQPIEIGRNLGTPIPWTCGGATRDGVLGDRELNILAEVAPWKQTAIDRGWIGPKR